MAQYLEWHMSQAGASDALLQQRLVAALSHLGQHASPEAFRKASRCAGTPPAGARLLPSRLPGLEKSSSQGRHQKLIRLNPLVHPSMAMQYSIAGVKALSIACCVLRACC